MEPGGKEFQRIVWQFIYFHDMRKRPDAVAKC